MPSEREEGLLEHTHTHTHTHTHIPQYWKKRREQTQSVVAMQSASLFVAAAFVLVFC